MTNASFAQNIPFTEGGWSEQSKITKTLGKKKIMDMEVRVLHIGGGLFDENIRCNSTAGEVLIAISAQHIYKVQHSFRCK